MTAASQWLACSLVLWLPGTVSANAPQTRLVHRGRPLAVRAIGKPWTQRDGHIELGGRPHTITAGVRILPGDFHVKARLRILDQKNSAASFFLGSSHFGFEGARGTLFLNGPLFGKAVRLLGPSTGSFGRGDWITLDVIRRGPVIDFRIDDKSIATARSEAGFDRFGFSPWRSTMQLSEFSIRGQVEPVKPAITLPTIDLDGQTHRQVTIDREPGQYLGHPTTCLLEDGKTLLCVYPRGHGRGAVLYKRSRDGGKTWSRRLPTPASWTTSKETPTLHRVIDPDGRKRIIMWSGLYPARLAVSEDDGDSWSELKPAGAWGGIVVMGALVPLRTGPGHYLAFFHDDGRFFTARPRKRNPVIFTLYKTRSTDGGLTWSVPRPILARSDVHLCEPGVIRSPDGKQLACLLRENSRQKNSHVIFSDNEGRSWSPPRELPASLSGDRHTGKYGPDGRLLISFRDRPARNVDTPSVGDWVAWVGRYEDIVAGREGQYRVRLKDNTKGADCAYPGVEVLPDGTFVLTTYGHWTAGEPPWILSVRLKLEELDRLARQP